MAEDQKSEVSETVESVIEKCKNLPAAQDASPEPPPDHRLFGRKKSVHQLLGGGEVADILVWKRPILSAGILGGMSVVYIVFEWLGCPVLSLLSTGALILVGALFLWSNIATFVKRSPLDIPMPRNISEEKALHAAKVVRDDVNLVLDMLHDVVQGKDVKLFLKVELALWILAIIGKWADFLTLVYLCVLLLLTVPLLLERHEDKVEHTLRRGYEQTRQLHTKLHDQVLAKLPQRLASREQKKSV
ncbi:hypothetical protein GOP47_0022070 [Adiantum capillus-veneris]|uniref:Reticulon-like protein n=1 Tax=Adiantum capillus-veneris TaxID=13818 RepID=A0A9D4U8P2_ADICA|nr:hypothetical protein GOP47_0022070 [Adiantum capillus-veneris]